MQQFKLTWRITTQTYTNPSNWQGFLRMIDRYDDVADEVAFYIVDDTYPELEPLEDKKKQAEFCKSCFRELRKRGCKVGINVWPTIPLWENEQAFFSHMRRMVGIDGQVIQSLACPTSQEFMDYMCQKYAIFAHAEPDFIWMDDDCRFTHMDGQYPCFCDDCVRGFQEGAFKSREALVLALDKPENRDLRIAWSSYGADRLAQLCAAVRQAVDQINPQIDIGLMTVGATHTTFSGDYISKCMTALRSRRGRPGHDLYSDRKLDQIMWKTLEAGRQVLEYPEETCDILWEEDSYPRDHLIKSIRVRANEVSLALMAGCTGIAFNHLGTNGDLDLLFGREIDELHALRPRWEKFFHFAKDLNWCGMWPLHSWFMTAKAAPQYAWLKESPFTHDGDNPCDLTPPEKIGPCGIPLTADSRYACATLLTGKTLTALDAKELQAVFSGNVYMDASALVALEELGLEKWAGVKINPTYYNIKYCLMTNHPFNGSFSGYNYRSLQKDKHTLIPLDESVEWLGYRADRKGEGDLCCISKYQNCLGGKIIVNGFDAWEFADSANNLFLFYSMAEWFDCPIRLRWKDPHVISRIQPYIRTNGHRAAVMLLNASLDSTNPLEIIVKGDMTRAVLLAPDGKEKILESHREGQNICIDIPTINAWDIAFLLIT